MRSHLLSNGECYDALANDPLCLEGPYWKTDCTHCAPGYTKGPAGKCVPCQAPSAQACARYQDECSCAECIMARPPHCSMHTSAAPTPHCLAAYVAAPFSCLACVPGEGQLGSPQLRGLACSVQPLDLRCTQT